MGKEQYEEELQKIKNSICELTETTKKLEEIVEVLEFKDEYGADGCCFRLSSRLTYGAVFGNRAVFVYLNGRKVERVLYELPESLMCLYIDKTDKKDLYEVWYEGDNGDRTVYKKLFLSREERIVVDVSGLIGEKQ